MIRPVSDIQSLCFMSLFAEMTQDANWTDLVGLVTSGTHEKWLSLGVFDRGLMVGLFMCELKERHIMIHACFLKSHRGNFARKAAKKAFSWIWNNTGYDKISAYIEPDHVKKYATECGMKELNGLFEVSRWADL